MIKRFQVFRSLRVSIILLSLFIPVVKAQVDRVPLTIRGETIISSGTVKDYPWAATSEGLYEFDPSNPFVFNSYKDFFVPPGRRIVSAHKKEASRNLIAILDDGSVYQVTTVGGGANAPKVKQLKTKVVAAGGSESWKEIQGDALYVMGSSYVYVTRDSADTWSLNATGLSGAFPKSLTLDTLQYVYLATNNGIYKQHPDTSIWWKHPTAPSGYYNAIFADRRNRITAAFNPGFGNYGIITSSDGGATWRKDSAGVGQTQISKFGDDAFGNTYAIGSDRLFRRPNNDSVWTRIDGPILALASPNRPPLDLFNDIGGDTVLVASTTFGLFASTNQGTTWQLAANPPAENIYGFMRHKSGKTLVSTSLGVFSRTPPDTVWSKIYPPGVYLGGQAIWTDVAGNLFSGFVNSPTSFPPSINWSTDGGTTWATDTAGLGKPRFPTYYVDETGGMHMFSGGGNSSILATIYRRTLAGVWTVDTAGFVVAGNGIPRAMLSDRKGFLYISGQYPYSGTRVNPTLMRRPIAGGTWVSDTAGLGAPIDYMGVMVADKKGILIGSAFVPGSGYKIFKRSGSPWKTIPLPPSLAAQFPEPTKLSVDSSNALFAAFRTTRDAGVWFTKDSGATWTYAGLDSIKINELVSYGDTTFALTNRGMYALTRNAPGTGVETISHGIPGSYSLDQNYPNPFNPKTTIGFQTPTRGMVELSVFDILGRQVAVLVHQELDAGVHRVEFDASRLATGAYFYRMKSRQIDGGQAGDFVDTKKLILLK